MEKVDLSVIILTYNEELHIRRCLEKITDIAKDVFIIDSFSTDRTLEIAKEFANVYTLQNKWENNYSKQFNWGLANAPIKTKWVLRLDADEYLSDQLKQEICEKLPSLPENVSGININLYTYFLGHQMKYGIYPVVMLRLFKFSKAKLEARHMDEHIQIEEGEIVSFKGAFYDYNLNNTSWWSNKQVGYSIREAVDLLDMELNLTGVAKQDKGRHLNKVATWKRNMKHRYAKLPLFWRPFFYFIYRYILKGGFRDGKEGFAWHFLMAWWYRTLVDVKVLEIKKACGTDKNKIRQYVLDNYNIKI